MKELSVVIPTYKRPLAVKKVLRSIDQQTFDFNQLEVFVVSNFEDQELENVINSMNLQNFEVNLLVASKLGANASRNLGIQKSNSSYIYLLDDDCCLKEKNSLNHLVKSHKEYSDVGVIGGGYEVAATATVNERAYNLISREWQYIHAIGDNTSTRLVGGNVSYKKEIFEKNNEYFDESIHYGGSESEFHKRLFKKNVKMIYLSDFSVLHEPQLTQADLISKARKQALTHAHFDIDGGGYVDQKKTYQDNPSVWALKYSVDNDEYNKIIELVELYNWAYHAVIKEPSVSLFKLNRQSSRWLNKRRTTVVGKR